MLNVTYWKNGVRLTHCWFATPQDIETEAYKKNAGDIIFLHGVPLVGPIIRGVKYTTQKTVIKNLICDEQDLFHSLGKHLQQYIKRSQKEALVITRIYEKRVWKEDEIKELCTLYEKMFQDKGLNAVFNKKLFICYASQKCLTVGIAYLSETPIGFSAVIHDDVEARLWLAAFDFRNEDLDRQVLSRAHQRLDWELLCWCNIRGIKHFDFGGVNSFDSPNGIAQFKMKFENTNRVEQENYLIPNTIIGKLALRFFLRGKC